jgi:hypothetical protein
VAVGALGPRSGQYRVVCAVEVQGGGIPRQDGLYRVRAQDCGAGAAGQPGNSSSAYSAPWNGCSGLTGAARLRHGIAPAGSGRGGRRMERGSAPLSSQVTECSIMPKTSCRVTVPSPLSLHCACHAANVGSRPGSGGSRRGAGGSRACVRTGWVAALRRPACCLTSLQGGQTILAAQGPTCGAGGSANQTAVQFLYLLSQRVVQPEGGLVACASTATEMAPVA